MKKLFTLSIALCFTVACFAQGFSAGINTGGTFWIPNKNAATEGWYKQSKKLVTWDKGVFLRYETKGRIALEASYNNFKINTRRWEDAVVTYNNCGTYDEGTHTHTNSLSNFNEINLGVQYRITPKTSTLKAHVGIALCYGINHYINETESTYSNGITVAGRYEEYGKYIMAGATYRVSYPIFKHCVVHLQGNGSWVMGTLTSAPLVNNDVWFRISGQGGISYLF